MATPDYGNMLSEFTDQQVKEQEHIDILTQSMRPTAETAEGQMALQDVMADQNQDKAVRAAAFQAIAPGFKARIGEHGELSFSAAPASDIGSPQTASTFQANQTQMQVQAGQQGNFEKMFAESYTAIRNETDTLKVTELQASLNANLTNFVASKEAAVRNRVHGSLGLPTLEAEIARSVQLDREFYSSQGMSYQGNTDETWALINQRDQMTARVNGMVQEELARDPEIAAAQTRLKSVETLVSQKFALAGQAMGQAGEDAGVFVQPEIVNAVGPIIGIDTTNPKGYAEVQKRVAAGDAQYLLAQQVASYSPQELYLKSKTKDTEGLMASRQLPNKMSPELVKKADQLSAELDSNPNAFANILTADQMALLKPTTNVASSPNDKAAEQQRIQMEKTNIVFGVLQRQRTADFEASISQGSWAPPTDPLLAEIPAILADNAKAGNKNMTVSQVMDRINYDVPNKAEKMKALANYLYSNAQTMQDSEVFGPPSGYGRLDQVEALVNASYSNAVYKKKLQTAAGSLQYKPSGF